MSNWKLITPEARTNLVTNPSAEVAITNWTNGGSGSTVSRYGSDSAFGAASIKVVCGGGTDQAVHSALIVDGTMDICASVWFKKGTVSGTATAHFTMRWIGGANPDATVQYASLGVLSGFGDDWERQTAIITPDYSDRTSVSPYFRINGSTAAQEFFIDAYQLENANNSYVTSYIDGTQPGCVWNGTPHASTSSRDKFAATGGIVNDLSDDLDFIVASQDGTGLPPVNNLSSALALQPGALFDGQTIRGRNITLTGSIIGSTVADFHAKKQALIKALNPNVTTIGTRSQARTFRYTGGAVDKEIYAVYDGGLEPGVPIGYTESDYKLRLKADDPLFYQVGESGAVLDTNESVVMRGTLRKVDGIWDGMGISTTALTNALAEDDVYIYMGGQFTNFNSIASGDNIVRYEKETSIFTALGAGMNGIVYALVVASDGTLYAGGSFTTAGGVSANRIAAWNGTAWSALGTGLDNTCWALTLAADGTLYAGGDFTTAGGVSANRIASWNGAAWAALGTGLGAVCRSLAVSANGTLYAGGGFLTAGAVSASAIASWDGATWAALGTGLGGTCFAITTTADGTLYAGGSFTTAGGVSANRIASWNGTAWAALGDGVDSNVNALYIDTSGDLYIVGQFSEKIKLWKGSVLTRVDVSPTILICVLVRSNGDLYIGGGTTTARASGAIAVEYVGTYNTHPSVKIKRVGGTSATIISVSNATTGAELLFDYALQDGETLTIDAVPGKQSITSSTQGNVYSALLAASDFGNFFLLPSNTTGAQENIITAFVDEVGSPTVTATMVWRDTYISED